MPVLGSLVTFVAGQVAQASQVNGNFAALRTWADNSVVLTDVAKTITASHTFNAAQTFSSTINGQTISAATNFTGSVDIAGVLEVADQIRFEQPAGVIKPGATSLTFRNHADNADNAVLTDAGVLTVRSGITVTAGGLTVTAGGANITGNSTITGNLTITGTVSGVSVVSGSVQSSDSTTTSTSPTSTNLSLALGANQTWRLDFDLAVSCDNTGGVTLVVTAPAGATIRTHWFGATSSATTMTSVSSTSGGAGGAAFSTFNSTASDGVRVTCSAYIVTSGTSGNAGLTVASVTGGQTSKVLIGSTVLGVRIA